MSDAPAPMSPELTAKFTELMAAVTGIKTDVDAMKSAPVIPTPGLAGKTAEMLAAGQAPAQGSPRESFADEQINALKSLAAGEMDKNAWQKHQGRVADNSKAEVAAWKAFIRNPQDNALRSQYDAAMKASMVEGTASLGGNLVPQLYSNTVVGKLKEDSIVRMAGATQVPVSGTNSFNVPLITRSGSAPLATELSAGSQMEPTFGNQAFVPYAYRALYIASREVVTDSRIPLDSLLMDNATWQLTQSENVAFAIGSGSSQPQGIATAASTLGLSPGSTLALAFPNGVTGGDLIMDVYHGLPYQYRQNAVWFANDTTIKAIRKMRDSAGGAASLGNYLWQPGLQAGQPDRLNGRPIYPLNNMATSGSTSPVLIFGDPRFFWITDFNNGGLDFQVLNELYAASAAVGWTFWKRFDSHLLVSEAVVGVKLLS